MLTSPQSLSKQPGGKHHIWMVWRQHCTHRLQALLQVFCCIAVVSKIVQKAASSALQVSGCEGRAAGNYELMQQSQHPALKNLKHTVKQRRLRIEHDRLVAG
jgi:hypothetical protein